MTTGSLPVAPELLRADGSWLRRVRRADAAGLFDAYAADPEATRFLSWPPRRSLEEVADWLAPRVAAWDEDTERRWVMADEPDGAAFGTVTLRCEGDEVVLGYALGRDRAGRGVATAAVTAVLDWYAGARRPGDATVVRARTDPDHHASIRVLEKCGFHPVERERSSWRAARDPRRPRDALRFEHRIAGR